VRAPPRAPDARPRPRGTSDPGELRRQGAEAEQREQRPELRPIRHVHPKRRGVERHRCVRVHGGEIARQARLIGVVGDRLPDAPLAPLVEILERLREELALLRVQPVLRHRGQLERRVEPLGEPRILLGREVLACGVGEQGRGRLDPLPRLECRDEAVPRVHGGDEARRPGHDVVDAAVRSARVRARSSRPRPGRRGCCPPRPPSGRARPGRAPAARRKSRRLPPRRA
jgi:hypothetical protein